VAAAWNVNHVDGSYTPGFLDVFESYVDGRSPAHHSAPPTSRSRPASPVRTVSPAGPHPGGGTPPACPLGVVGPAEATAAVRSSAGPIAARSRNRGRAQAAWTRARPRIPRHGSRPVCSIPPRTNLGARPRQGTEPRRPCGPADRPTSRLDATPGPPKPVQGQPDPGARC